MAFVHPQPSAPIQYANILMHELCYLTKRKKPVKVHHKTWSFVSHIEN